MKTVSHFLFILSAVLVSTLFLAACVPTPTPEEEHNLLKIWNSQTVNVGGYQADVLITDDTWTSTDKMTVYTVVLAEKGNKKSLIVAPVEIYRGIDLSEYAITDSNYLMIATTQIPVMYHLGVETAEAEGATSIFYTP